MSDAMPPEQKQKKALDWLTDTNVNEMFNMPFAQVFERWIQEHQREITGKLEANYQTMLLMATINGGILLIDGYQGRNHTTENFAKREWKELMTSIGRDGVPPYSCRHTFITRSIRSGVDLITLESIVGHVDKETTKLYTHLKAKDLVAAVQKTNAVDYKLATQKKPSAKSAG